VHADVSKDADWGALVKATKDAFGAAHRRQQCRHDAPQSADAERDRGDVRSHLCVNVKSLFHSAKHCVPHFRAQAAASSSTYVRRPECGRARLTWYNGSKGAAIMTSRSMAVELGPTRSVCIINPVIGETGCSATSWACPTRPRIAPGSSAHSTGPDEPAARHRNAALWLASDEAEFITGTCIEVDGEGAYERLGQRQRSWGARPSDA